MGAAVGAVLPAVVVPGILRLMDEKYRTGKSIPPLIMAGASCDDIFVIVLFSSFAAMAQGGQASAAVFLGIPISIALGAAAGAANGWAMTSGYECGKILAEELAK